MRIWNGSSGRTLNLRKKNSENGQLPEEAHYAARRAFGNPTLIREQTHETWGWAPFERLLQDIRFAFRQLKRSPDLPLRPS